MDEALIIKAARNSILVGYKGRYYSCEYVPGTGLKIFTGPEPTIVTDKELNESLTFGREKHPNSWILPDMTPIFFWRDVTPWRNRTTEDNA